VEIIRSYVVSLLIQPFTGTDISMRDFLFSVSSVLKTGTRCHICV